ncbi:hypothetical protein pipiens_005982 [Culex pipiens pipiens]|uniref:Secreted protein n=1 Tax=Culex pipiens pipiens TaxID=38569 RepID=A0ABD1DST6_CULPP
MRWLLVGIVCCAVSHAHSEEIGATQSLNRKLESNAKLLRSSLDELVAPLGKLDLKFRTPAIRKAADSVTGIARSVADIGRKLADGFDKIAARRTESVENVAETVSSPFDELAQFFADEAPGHVANLERLMGGVSGGEFRTALEGVNKASEDSSKAVDRLTRGALKSSGDPTTPDVGSSLLKIRDQVEVLARAIESSASNIMEANSQMEIAGLVAPLIDIPFDPKVWFEFILFDFEVAAAVDRYQTTVRNVHTDLSAAVRRLDIFAQNKDLQPLIESHSEAYTRIYYELTNRNQTDVATIQRGFESIRTNISDIMNITGTQFYTEMHAAEDALATMFLARNSFAAQCSRNHIPSITASLAPLQGEIVTCLSRERLHLPRLGENVNKVLQLLQTNNVDFAADISSCTRFPLASPNDQGLNQARGCLETNVDELNQYGQLLSSELDQLQTVVQLEADASVFRTNLCIKQSTNEAASLLKGIQRTINRCAVTGM